MRKQHHTDMYTHPKRTDSLFADVVHVGLRVGQLNCTRNEFCEFLKHRPMKDTCFFCIGVDFDRLGAGAAAAAAAATDH